MSFDKRKKDLAEALNRFRNNNFQGSGEVLYCIGNLFAEISPHPRKEIIEEEKAISLKEFCEDLIKNFIVLHPATLSSFIYKDKKFMEGKHFDGAYKQSMKNAPFYVYKNKFLEALKDYHRLDENTKNKLREVYGQKN